MIEYSYECPECKEVYTLAHSFKSELTVKCPACRVAMERLVGAVAGIHIKGSMFVGGKRPKDRETVWRTRNIEKDGFND